jgi:hypothetical protein
MDVARLRRTLRPPYTRTTLTAALVVLALVAVVVLAVLVPMRSGSPSGTRTRAAGSASLVAYRGLGTWVDIFDARAWKDPAAAVADMASHGARTLFIETGNSHSKSAFNHPVQIELFIREAHAHGMRIVAWYLPDLKSEAKDLDRVSQAITFRTVDGQSFDSFALDIESSAVRPESKRNAALASLSRKIRAVAGPSYPLGAIIPSPVGLARRAHYWDAFPYESIARTYDVFLPMAYYTYHGTGAQAARADAVDSVRIIRAQKGCATVPIHLIGGLADKSTTREVTAFVRGVRESGCIGASLYGWPGTSAGAWRALGAVK